MKIAVVGAGGIGGYVGGRLAEAGESVHLVARGRHLEALRRNGLRIECPLGDVTLPGIEATDDPAEIGPVDVVVFAVKLGGTDAAARSLAPLIGGHTRIVTLQNGIDSKEMIARHVDETQIAAGCTYLSAHIREPGVIHAPGGAHGLIIDELSGDPAIAAFVRSCLAAEHCFSAGAGYLATYGPQPLQNHRTCVCECDFPRRRKHVGKLRSRWDSRQGGLLLD